MVEFTDGMAKKQTGRPASTIHQCEKLSLADNKLSILWVGMQKSPLERQGRINARGSMVSVSFSCECGEMLSLPETWPGHKAFCLRCRRNVPLPDGVRRQLQRVSSTAATRRLHAQTNWLEPADEHDRDHTTVAAPVVAAASSEAGPGDKAAGTFKLRKTDEKETVEVEMPVHFEWVFGPDGKEHWKLTCPCGKRLLTPAPSPHPYGTCPKCQRKLPLPGYEHQPQVTRVGARPETETREDYQESRTTIAAAAAKRVSSDPSIKVNAASTAADRLRPSRANQEPVPKTNSGRISAWPQAGLVRRGLATFIDLTVALTIGGIAILSLQSMDLPVTFFPAQILTTAAVVTIMFNEIVVQLLFGGTIGKRLVLIVVRSENGNENGAFQTLIRALAKWLLLPGCIVALFDATERTLHDVLCGTMVLKGRARKN
jgi:uncharacterized RDD family membrane protein YckC